MSADSPPAAIGHLSSISTVSELPADGQFERYHEAARKYVLHLTGKDEDATQEVLRTILVKFRNGLLAKWPGKGRFRDYLKRTLRNAVCDHVPKRKAAATRNQEHWIDIAGIPEVEAPNTDPWDRLYADDLLKWVSAALRAADRDPVLHTVVRAVLEEKSDGKTISSEELAKRLKSSTGKEYTQENARQQKARTLKRFREMLNDHIAAEIEAPTPEAVEAELEMLDLLRCVAGIDKTDINR